MDKYAQTAKRKLSAVPDPEPDKRESDKQDRAQVVRNGVVAAILEHRLHPGTKLGEDDLGQIYGVSRTLVRTRCKHWRAKASWSSRKTAVHLSPGLP